MREIGQLLDDPACQLLTLVGPGGIGKTRLAVEVAEAINPHPQPLFPRGLPSGALKGRGEKMQDGSAMGIRTNFADGVYFVPLQALTSPDFIVGAIAEALGFQFYAGDSRRQLLDYLRDKTMLLVMDNFEHLMDGVTLASEILEAAPGVRILVTSRERLNLLEEWVFDVHELKYPTNDAEAEMENYEAVQLFIQHAQRAYRSFNLTDEQKPAITRICRLVDGMPLGIELAASWVRVLSCDAIADEIERNLDILNTPMRNIEPRHRTMRAAFEPTWNRLSVAESQAFKRLSVFRGGFSREAAEVVAGASLRTLSALVDKSLLRVGANGRYDIHELLRQYAGEQLSPEEHDQAHGRHSAYYAEVLHQQWEHLRGRHQKQALREIEAELDNVRASWKWAATHQQTDSLDKMMDSLWFFYDIYAHNQEGWQAFQMAVESLTRDAFLRQPHPPAPSPQAERGSKNQPGEKGIQKSSQAESVTMGRLLAQQGGFAFSLTQPKQARQLLENGLTILRQHEAHRDTAFALLRLSEVTMFHESNPAAAKLYLQESLMIYQQSGDEWGIAYAIRWLGFAALLLEDFEEARRLGQESFATYQKTGDLGGMAIALSIVGLAALGMQDYPTAKQAGQESLALCREIGLHWAMVQGLLAAAGATCALGEYDESRRFFQESLKITSERRFIGDILWTFVESANLWMAFGRQEWAVELLTFSLHYPIPPAIGTAPILRLLAKLEAEMPAGVFQAASERGKMRDLDATVSEVLAELEALDTSVTAARSTSSRSSVDSLSEREMEILRLLADGLTNQQIAEKLFLVLGTVKSHNNHIFSKLGVKNRTQAIKRAGELGLV